MSYIGDYAEDYATLNFKFTTVAADGTPTTLLGTPVISVYAANGLVQSIAGITLTVDFDGVTGLNNVLIDLSSAAFYAVGKDYQVIITTGTVDSISVVGYVVAEFSIQNRFMRGTDSVPTNPILNTENGSSFSAIPDMAKDSTVAKDATVATVAKQDTMQIDVTLAKRILNNKKILDVDNSQWLLYDDAGVAVILTWPAYDKDGNKISVDTGVPTQVGVPY